MSSSNDPDPLIGRLVAGRYEVLKKLNQGGVGAVYLAMQRPLDRPVALKVLLKKHADDETAIKRFEKEAAAVARLAHAHIVTLYDFGSTDAGDMYIAMEFLRGQSLRDLLDAAGFVPWERSLHIVQGICRALVAAHTQKIVHRDLKPENVMLVESNGDLDFAKVLDFGLARSIQSHNQPAITRHDVIPGTPVYMSPERANGISNDPRSDLYALGAVWFELLVGEPPFPGETSIKIILRHIHEQPRRPSQAQPKNPIPPFIDDLVIQLLEKTVERRPPTARHLLDHLDALARPTGWHVGRPQEVGRRGQHDTDLQGFATAASNLGDDMRFAIEEGEPLPLVKKKPPPAALPPPPEEAPVLLLQKKKPTASMPLSAVSAPSRAPPPDPTPLLGTPLAAPASAPPASWLPPPPTSPSGPPSSMPSPSTTAPIAAPLPRQPTEDFLRPALDAAERAELLTTPRAPAKIESLAQVAGWLSTARTARTVGELCCAFLVTRFDRALVVDVRNSIPMLLGTATAPGPALAAPPIVHALPESRGLIELASRREAYYGPALHGPDWMPWFGSLGGSAPGAMFVGGLQRDGKPAFLFYADHKDITLRPMVKDTVVLLREAAAALSLIG